MPNAECRMPNPPSFASAQSPVTNAYSKLPIISSTAKSVITLASKLCR